MFALQAKLIGSLFVWFFFPLQPFLFPPNPFGNTFAWCIISSVSTFYLFKEHSKNFQKNYYKKNDTDTFFSVFLKVAAKMTLSALLFCALGHLAWILN